MPKKKRKLSLKDKLFPSKRKSKTNDSDQPRKPVFQTEGSKQTAKEFKMAIYLALRIYKLLSPFPKLYGEPEVRFRLQAGIQAVLQSISPSANGDKEIGKGNWELLEGLRFDTRKSIDMFLNILPDINVDLQKGIQVEIMAKNRQLFIDVPRAVKGVVKIEALVLDLENEDGHLIKAKPLIVDLKLETFNGGRISLPVKFAGLQLVLLVVGIHYNDGIDVINNKKYKAAEIRFSRVLKEGIVVEFEENVVKDKPKAKPDDDEEVEWE